MNVSSRGLSVLLALAVVASMATGAGVAQSAPTVSTSEQTVTVGDTATYDVSLSSAPDGLRLYNVTVSLTDGSVADVGPVGSGDLPGFSVVSRTADSVTFRAADLSNSVVPPGSTDVLLGEVTLNQTAVGSTDVSVTVNQMQDHDGNTVAPAVDGGSLTVSDTVTVTETLTLADGSAADSDTVEFTSASGRLVANLSAAGSYSRTVTAGVTYQRDYLQVETQDGTFPNDGTVDIYSLGERSFDSDTDLGTTQLPQGYDLNVTVVDGSGDPVNATVSVGVGAGGAVPAATWTETTGPDGVFQTHPNSPGIEVNGDVVVTADPGSGFEGAVSRNLTVTSDRDVTLTVARTDTGGDDDGSGGDGDGGTAPAGNTTVDVVLADASDGLQTFNVTVAAEGSTVTAYEAGDVTPLQNPSGGVGESSVTLRAADLARLVEPGTSSEVRLATVNFSGAVSESNLTLTVNDLTDDGGDDIPPGEVSLAVEAPSDGESAPVFEGPVPGTGASTAPTDPDDDGEFEDVDGDGTVEFEDAISLAFADFAAVNDDPDQQAALDFDDSGSVGFEDAISLAFQV